ncbi:YIP1 family protein [Thalassococcus sp. BH17M4-6]|uniref:YIP1 family protein n=1 Tax=Thalassococcus sp. BH17M4-6 TaxID=3413148 RepID=UPI003BCDD5D6
MTLGGFLRLAWQTLVAPREVARLLLSLRLGHEALLLAFALVVVLNTMIFLATAQISPPSDALVPLLSNPVIFMLTLGGTLGVTAIALTWTGRSLGGVGRIEGVGLLLIWLQAVRMLVQLAVMVLMTIDPGLAGLVVVAASVLGVWILTNFLDEAHGFDSLFKAALVLLLGVTGMALGLSFFLTLIGATTMGLTTNV